jgi:ABC-type amino acid transport substrate-binding protein
MNIATVDDSAAAEYLDLQTNLLFQDYSVYAETLEALKNNDVDAIIYDAPVL